MIDGEQTIEEAFEAFHAANPHVYRHLVRLARVWRERRGDERLGIGMLFEVLRWQLKVETRDGDSAWRLNNNYRSHYARLIMDREPDLAGVFETRALHAPVRAPEDPEHVFEPETGQGALV